MSSAVDEVNFLNPFFMNNLSCAHIDSNDQSVLTDMSFFVELFAPKPHSELQSVASHCCILL